MLEMQGMMAYGGAEGSMSLLWKLGLLPLVFPAHAKHLADCYRDRCAVVPACMWASGLTLAVCH